MYKKPFRPFQNSVYMGIYEIFCPTKNICSFVGYSENLPKSITQNILDAKNGNIYKSLPTEFFNKMRSEKKKFLDLSVRVHLIEPYNANRFAFYLKLADDLFCLRAKSMNVFTFGYPTPQKTETRKATAVYELYCPLNTDQTIAYVGQSLDFESRFLDHFLGIKNSGATTSQKLLNKLTANKKNYSDVFLTFHYFGLMHADSKFEIDYVETERIAENKANTNLICCNILD